MRGKGIMAYGTEEDRLKLEVLSRKDLRSGSSWIIDRIRAEYRKFYADVPPAQLLTKNE